MNPKVVDVLQMRLCETSDPFYTTPRPGNGLGAPMGNWANTVQLD